MNGESADSFLSRMTVKLGTTPAQLRNTMLGLEPTEDHKVSVPVFITGTSPMIHILKTKVVGVSNAPTVVTTRLSTSGSAESQNFLNDTDDMASKVKDSFVAWASDYFALQLGMQDALEFSAQTIPSDIGVEKSLANAKSKIETAMLQRLVSSVSVDVLKCDPMIMEFFNNSDGKGAIPKSIMERFLEIAKKSEETK